ncbi:MAG: tetratricopeptide repeat protein [Desulfuromonadaceae bacterium]|nr:tetratricopeptide repeat protein [Desulfuromonadaceae bacterium]MDD2854996.1 tetratricopeptide repeat protein [Desulfuromonadaceae bacterium]
MKSAESKHNPYDFANPVSDKNIFSGRKKQLEEIRYYLAQAVNAPRAINLALLGERASGKTSMLNMISIEAKELGFCVVRIDLNEGDVENQLSFFYKLFDSILSEALEFTKEDSNYCFGGKAGKTYDAYLDMTCAYDVPENKIWAPFFFPVQYAKAMSKGCLDIKVGDAIIKKDLQTLSNEVVAPIALLFDECNVLTENRILLEMMRNIFMNLPGYMLVFTGTPNLFPLMDEVFSPIVRQFKRINIDPFVSWREIRECIEKPLKSISKNIQDVMEVDTFIDLTDIQSLTGGKPYEIQLLCHYMYKGYESGHSDKMQLSIDVFDEVLIDLAKGKDIRSRIIISKLQEVSAKSIKALRLLASCCGKATFDDIWAIECLVNDNNRWDKHELYDQLEYLENNNILNVMNDIIFFNGDDFDRIYSKYFSRQHNNFNLSINDYPQDIFTKIALDSKLRKFSMMPFDQIKKNLEDVSYSKELRSQYIDLELDINIDGKDKLIKEIIVSYSNKDITSLKNSLGLAIHIYWLLYEQIANSSSSIDILIIDILSKKLSMKLMYYYDGNEKTSNITEMLSDMKNRGEGVSINFEYIIESFNLPTIDDIKIIVRETFDDDIKEFISKQHVKQMAEIYLDNGSKELCKLNADLACNFNEALDANAANNIGYVYMALGEFDSAVKMFNTAIKQDDKHNTKQLAYYNLGVLEIYASNILKSVEYFTKCIDEIEIHGGSSECACIFLIGFENNKIITIEDKNDPDLLMASKNAIAVIKNNFNCEVQ